MDFIDEEKQPLDDLLPTAAEQLKDENLFMNEAKTEFTHVHLSDTQEVDEDGEPYVARRSGGVKYLVHYSAAHLTSQLIASRETLLSSPTGNCGVEVRRSPLQPRYVYTTQPVCHRCTTVTAGQLQRNFWIS